jgi:hypothetical protein
MADERPAEVLAERPAEVPVESPDHVDLTAPVESAASPIEPLSTSPSVTALAVIETTALGLKLLTISMVILTLIGVAILGPFGFIPALLVAPLALLTWACQRAAQMWKDRYPDAEFEEPVLLQTLSPTPHPVLDERRMAHAESVARIHHSLPNLLEIFESEQDLSELVSLTRSLRIMLGEHFADDEAPGGLFEELVRLDPHVETDVRVLTHEHTRILGELDRLIHGYGDFRLKLETRRHGQIRNTRHELIERIRSHQRAEDRLIQTVYGVSLNTDLAAQA